MKVLVTGASGFIGRSLVPYLGAKFDIRTASLRNYKESSLVLDGVHAIIHLAGVAHQMLKTDSKIYFRINRDLTLALAEQAKRQGVRHFIFVSSTKVFGEVQGQGVVFNEYSECSPVEPYGRSKLEAEVALQKMETDQFAVAIIRPPLVYGPGVKGNLERLISIIQRSPLLPFGGIDNRRSTVSVDNLTSLIEHLIHHRLQGTFIAGDEEPHSTTKMVTVIRDQLGASTRLVTLPKTVITIMKLVKPSLVNRLFDSFVIDNSVTNKRIKFSPPFTFEEGIKKMIADI